METVEKQITGRTWLIGVMADPVSQARALDVGNSLLQSRGQHDTFVVVPLQVAADGLEPVVEGMRHIKNLAGIMVSMPHKQKIMPLLDTCSPEARLGGAVNVVRRTPDGRLEGHLLDGEGFVAGLVAAGHPVRGASCVLAGAGGAASAIAFALVRNGCRTLALLNRTIIKAEEVAARIREAFPGAQVTVGETGEGPIDIAINGTSLGMRADDDLPFDLALVSRCRVVAECVIAPEMTPLLQLAEKNGSETHRGIHMLRAQIVDLLEFMGAGAP